MRTIWIITAGLSDLQLPVWRCEGPNEETQFRIPIQPATGTARNFQELLLTLLRHQKIYFPNSLPPLDRHAVAKVEITLENAEFMASYVSNPPGLNLAPGKQVISSAEDDRFPLLCPKIAPLTKTQTVKDAARDGLTAVVLQTNRNSAANESEPVAVGPIISQFIGQQLGLQWLDSRGQIFAPINVARAATWLDVLIGDESLEANGIWDTVRQRLHAFFDVFESGDASDIQILVSSGGGMPELKSIVEYLCTARYGDGRIKLLTASERGTGTATPVSLSDRPGEIESLRVQCTEALRHSDFIGAYGLASRDYFLRKNRAEWALDVLTALGPMLDFDLSRGPRIGATALDGWQLLMIQIEAAFCRRDTASAIKGLHRFLESATWLLFSRSPELQRSGIAVEVTKQFVTGNIAAAGLLFESLPTPAGQPERHRPKYLQDTANWLARPSHSLHQSSSAALAEYWQRYREKPVGMLSLMETRNMLSHATHGGLDHVTLEVQILSLIERQEFSTLFGNNFLTSGRALAIMAGLATPDAASPLEIAQRELSALLARVWRS